MCREGAGGRLILCAHGRPEESCQQKLTCARRASREDGSSLLDWAVKVKGISEQEPVCAEQPHNLPVAHAAQPVLRDKLELFFQASHILKPYFVLQPVYFRYEKDGLDRKSVV